MNPEGEVSIHHPTSAAFFFEAVLVFFAQAADKAAAIYAVGSRKPTLHRAAGGRS